MGQHDVVPLTQKVYELVEANDSHIHLFAEPYWGQGETEESLYGRIRAAHGIGSALVVGFEGEQRFLGNNRHILGLARRED